MVSYHPDPPQLLRARLRLALHSYGGEDLNRLVHHEQGRYFAVAAGIVDRETLDAAGELLDAHIRLEERQLFPLIEELVPDDELRRLGLASKDLTCAVRRPAPHELKA